jgi:hypothetical protein
MKENDIKEKEINLLELITIFFNWVIKITNSAFKLAGSLLQLLFRHLVISSIIVLICLICSLYYTRPQARVYKAEALALLYGSDAQTVREISKQIEFSGPEDSYTSLASKLSIPDSVAKNIVGFHSYTVIGYVRDNAAVKVDYADNYPQKDTMYMKMRDRVSMQLLVKDINQVPQIQKAILNYFNNNEMLKTHLDNSKNQMTQQIRISEVELKRVDSLAKVTYFKDNSQQIKLDKNKLLFGEQQKQLFYNDLLRLQDIISSCKSGLANFKQAVELPSGFAVDPKPVNGVLKYAVLSIILGLIISLVFAGLVENISKIISYLKSKS